MLARLDGALVVTPEEIRSAEWMIAMTNMLISKIERTGDYIATLEASQCTCETTEADLGTELGGDHLR